MSARAPAPVGATCNRSAAGLGGAALREETLLELADAVADVERVGHDVRRMQSETCKTTWHAPSSRGRTQLSALRVTKLCCAVLCFYLVNLVLDFQGWVRVRQV